MFGSSKVGKSKSRGGVEVGGRKGRVEGNEKGRKGPTGDNKVALPCLTRRQRTVVRRRVSCCGARRKQQIRTAERVFSHRSAPAGLLCYVAVLGSAANRAAQLSLEAVPAATIAWNERVTDDGVCPICR